MFRSHMLLMNQVAGTRVCYSTIGTVYGVIHRAYAVGVPASDGIFALDRPTSVGKEPYTEHSALSVS